MKTNQELKSLYADLYDRSAYQTFLTFPAYEDTFEIVFKDIWRGKRVLEIGCGEGDLASILAICGAHMLAIDYAESAIETATSKYHLPNLEFRCCNYTEVAERFDIVAMQGVLEHMDDPLETLETISSKLLKRPGKIITSSPSFLNPRGYIWMALQLLLDVPMSRSDLHFLCPFDFEHWAQELGAQLTYSSVDQDWGHGERLLIDFDKRLRNAFRDRGLEANVDKFLEWLPKTLDYSSFTSFSGGQLVYDLHFN